MPSAAIADHDVKVNEFALLSSWLSYAGADGRPAAVQYQFLDTGTAANSGYFWTADVGQRASSRPTAITPGHWGVRVQRVVAPVVTVEVHQFTERAGGKFAADLFDRR